MRPRYIWWFGLFLVGLLLWMTWTGTSPAAEQCQHYSWRGGPLEEGQIPPEAPGEGWQANDTEEPHLDNPNVTWLEEVGTGLHFTGDPGRANWFDFICSEIPVEPPTEPEIPVEPEKPSPPVPVSPPVPEPEVRVPTRIPPYLPQTGF